MISDNIQFVVGTQALSKTNPMPAQIQDSTKATYAVAGVNNTPAATATDVVTISGSATKSVRIKKVTLSGFAGTAGTMRASLFKRTAANTGGTSTTVTAAQFDSTDAAPTAVCKLYTANPSAVGTGVMIAAGALNFGLTGYAGNLTFDFADRNDKPIILNSATEFLAINLNGNAVPASGTFDYMIEFEEV